MTAAHNVSKRDRARMRRLRTGATCHYCTAPAETVDHLIPRVLGGTEGLWNLVPACAACNLAKDDALPSCACDRCTTALNRFLETSIV